MTWYQNLIRYSNLFLNKACWNLNFMGDLVYKFRKIVGRNDLSEQFKKITVRYERIGYNMNVMRQTACLVVKPKSRLTILLPSLIANRRVGPQT